METPVLFVLFNRPDITATVFEAIRKARPKRLYIAADGPRKGNVDDEVSCREVRAVVENIDWDCVVKRRFLTENAGCCLGVSSAISWFFENEEEGIILEDDCLPHPSFFTFCETLLERYRDNHSIMHIAGANLQFGRKYGEYSYFFSTIPHIWGWASWRRAWNQYDLAMSDYKEFLRYPNRSQYFLNKTCEYYWINRYADIYFDPTPTTWDVQWFYQVLKRRGICVVPQVNLITNIGCGNKAVHSDINDPTGNLPMEDIGEIVHPAGIEIMAEADMFCLQHVAKWTTSSRFHISYRKIIFGVFKRITNFFGIPWSFFSNGKVKCTKLIKRTARSSPVAPPWATIR